MVGDVDGVGAVLPHLVCSVLCSYSADEVSLSSLASFDYILVWTLVFRDFRCSLDTAQLIRVLACLHQAFLRDSGICFPIRKETRGG